MHTTIDLIELRSAHLKRIVTVDIYGNLVTGKNEKLSLLLVNDGQDLRKMNFKNEYESFSKTSHQQLVVAGIHCGKDRLNEYGMSVSADYKGQGAKAGLYERFIVDELLPLLKKRHGKGVFSDTAFLGFSLGGLSALDIAWNHPEIFSKVGVFSGALWWRSVDHNARNFNPNLHRMMHRQIRDGAYRKGMKFFFECGELDETADRNNNGVIDSIDDTIDLMRELIRKGYCEGVDFSYLQIPEGKHDVATWAKAIPAFFKWGWGSSS